MKWNGKVTLDVAALQVPKRWVVGRTIFVNSMSDLFHEQVPLDFIQQVFTIMVEAAQHTFQILTKRAERAAELSAACPGRRMSGWA